MTYRKHVLESLFRLWDCLAAPPARTFRAMNRKERLAAGMSRQRTRSYMGPRDADRRRPAVGPIQVRAWRKARWAQLEVERLDARA